MNLQQFVTNAIEAMGGVVEPVEYALCDVLLPDGYRGIFQGRNELLLAFDYEVAQENPDAEFITFGSGVLEQLMEHIRSRPSCTIRYAVAERLGTQNLPEKIGRAAGFERCEVSIQNERPVLGMWADFVFKTSYVSDEKVSEVTEAWVNLVTGDIEREMAKAAVFYEKEPVYDYPCLASYELGDAYTKAYDSVMEEASGKASNMTRQDVMESEKQRITDYYQDLREENLKRMERKGLSDKRINELEMKLETLETEREKQLREMRDKYTVRPEVELEHGIIYMIPATEYRIDLSLRNDKRYGYAYYNPVLKSFFTKNLGIEK